MIKCVLIDVDNVVVAEVVEMDAEIGDPNCKLIKPYLFNSIDDMKPWKSEITNQTEFMIRSEDILTIADPTNEVIEKYTELAKEALSNGDKILSENYLQHADHFIRISDKLNSDKTNNEIHTSQSNLNKVNEETDKQEIDLN